MRPFSSWVSLDTTRLELPPKIIKLKVTGRVTPYTTRLVKILGQFRTIKVYIYCKDTNYHVVLLAAFGSFPLLIALTRLLFAPAPAPASVPQVRGSDSEHDGSPDQQRQLPPGQSGPGLRFDGL